MKVFFYNPKVDIDYLYYDPVDDTLHIHWFNLGNWISDCTGHPMIFIGEI